MRLRKFKRLLCRTHLNVPEDRLITVSILIQLLNHALSRVPQYLCNIHQIKVHLLTLPPLRVTPPLLLSDAPDGEVNRAVRPRPPYPRAAVGDDRGPVKLYST